MKRVITMIVFLMILGLLFLGCKKKETVDVKRPAVEQTKETEKADTEENGPLNADENCSKAYDFMKQFVEQMEQQMAKMGKQPPRKKEFPPKEKFVKACKDLPTEIIRCLDMEYSMKHQQECLEAKKNADPEKMKKFEEALK
ncbi:MAG: hypothetical protein ACP5QK_11070 [Myxococcota bacterium]